jgi:hypothetical protein
MADSNDQSEDRSTRAVFIYGPALGVIFTSGEQYNNWFKGDTASTYSLHAIADAMQWPFWIYACAGLALYSLLALPQVLGKAKPFKVVSLTIALVGLGCAFLLISALLEDGDASSKFFACLGPIIYGGMSFAILRESRLRPNWFRSSTMVFFAYVTLSNGFFSEMWGYEVEINGPEQINKDDGHVWDTSRLVKPAEDE